MLLCRQAVRDRRLRLARQCTVCASFADAGHIGKKFVPVFTLKPLTDRTLRLRQVRNSSRQAPG